MTLRLNKACEVEDFADPELAAVIRDVAHHKVAVLPDFPARTEHRKDWEIAMAVLALRRFGALRPDAVVLGVAAGTEDTVFYLTGHVRQVFATDRYLAAGDWEPTAPMSMLVDPSAVAPYAFDPTRLVVQHMDARSLSYPDDTFDGIFSSGSIEHVGELTDVAHAAYEMGRVLKPGGILSLSTELRLSGPPGGIGVPGQTLFLSPENLRRYVIEATGLEPVDELEASVSEASMATCQDLSGAIEDRRARMASAAANGDSPEFVHWQFPHIVLRHGEYLLTSVHLALRKPPDAYPVTDNAWAAPSPAVREAIRLETVALLSASRGASSTVSYEQATPLSAPPAPPPPPSGPLAALDARLTELDQRRAEIQGLLAAVQARTDQVAALLSTRLSRRPEPSAPVLERPDPAATSRSPWVTGRVELLEGIGFDVVVDPRMTDPVATALIAGQIIDRHLVEVMLQIVKPGDLVLDLGAHLGAFSLAAAAAGCRVLAVEASPQNAALLRASAGRNGFTQLRVVQAAVSDAPGSLDFVAHGPWGRVASEKGEGNVTVPAVTVDEMLHEFAFAPLAFVKIDVEGSEIPALRGMPGLLGGPAAPPLLVESNGHTLAFSGATPSVLLAELERWGYAAHMVEPGRLIRAAAHELQPQTIVDYLAFRTQPAGLAWPVEPGLSIDDRVARIVADSRFPNADHRAHIGAALSAGDDALLAHPSVVAALDALLADPVDGVRRAVAWWAGRQA